MIFEILGFIGLALFIIYLVFMLYKNKYGERTYRRVKYKPLGKGRYKIVDTHVISNSKNSFVKHLPIMNTTFYSEEDIESYIDQKYRELSDIK